MWLNVILAFASTVAVVVTVLAPVAPAGAEVANPHGVAVIIGNADYEHRDVPDVTFAHRDADAFRGYVVEVLGFRPGERHRPSRRDAQGALRHARHETRSAQSPLELS